METNMNATKPGRVVLIDEADGPGRTTATLVASLAARRASLHPNSGGDAGGGLASRLLEPSDGADE